MMVPLLDMTQEFDVVTFKVFAWRFTLMSLDKQDL